MAVLQSWSAVGGHAQVSVVLAPRSDCPGEGARAEADRLRSIDGLTVLLVEDSWQIAVAMKTLLENAGVVVLGPAGSLARAAALLDKSTPDAAIVDVNLKGKMSFELIERLRCEGVPVIVVTGYDDVEGLEGGYGTVLRKPVRAGALIAALSRLAASRIKTGN